MKTITIQLKDKTMEALDKVAGSYNFRKYPIEQAYSLIIDEIIFDIQKHSPYPLIPCCCCCYVPEHQHPPAWCMDVKEE